MYLYSTSISSLLSACIYFFGGGGGRYSISDHNLCLMNALSNYRCFLTAGSPSLPPSRSRLVEALCLLLIQRHTSPIKGVDRSGKSTYTSRFKCIVSSYNDIRTRLLNSQELLEGTNLTLFHINETTVTNW